MPARREFVHDPALVKLGRRPIKPEKYAAIRRMSTYLAEQLPTAKPSTSYRNSVSSWGMMCNDREGCCTIASIGHLVLCRSTLDGAPQLIDDNDIQDDYVAVTGVEGAAYDPSTGANDNGCVITDVLDYFKGRGILSSYVAFDASNQAHTMFAIDAFEGVDMGVGLPISAQSQEIWDVADPGLRGDSAPGSWGGHSMYAVDYDDKYVYLVTWGAIKLCTWNWWRTYVKRNQGGEAYALIFARDIASGTKLLPSGFNIQQLLADEGVIQSEDDSITAREVMPIHAPIAHGVFGAIPPRPDITLNRRRLYRG